MSDRLTASGILAHVLESAGVRTGTTIDRKDLENMAASLDGQLADLLATAKREAEQAAEIERLNARVRELEEALTNVDAKVESIARTALGKEERTC